MSLTVLNTGWATAEAPCAGLITHTVGRTQLYRESSEEIHQDIAWDGMFMLGAETGQAGFIFLGAGESKELVRSIRAIDKALYR